MKKLVFIAAASKGLAFPSGVVIEVKDDKEAQKYIDEGAAREATKKDLEIETADSKAAAKRETATKK